MASRDFLICSVAMASRLAVGSSRKIIGGFFKNNLAMAILCCCPPKVALHRDYIFQVNPKSVRADRLFCCFFNFFKVAFIFPYRILSSILP
jgi:hypothetical protein